MGGDSASVGGLDMSVSAVSKVFRNGEFLIGVAGSWRVNQILRYAMKPPEIPGDLVRYMCIDFVNSMRTALKECGSDVKDEGEERHKGAILVGIHGRIFRIDYDYQVNENLAGFDSVGCGESYALGSLHSTTGPAAKRVQKALEAAAQWSAGVRGPFLVEHT